MWYVGVCVYAHVCAHVRLCVRMCLCTGWRRGEVVSNASPSPPLLSSPLSSLSPPVTLLLTFPGLWWYSTAFFFPFFFSHVPLGPLQKKKKKNPQIYWVNSCAIKLTYFNSVQFSSLWYNSKSCKTITTVLEYFCYPKKDPILISSHFLHFATFHLVGRQNTELWLWLLTHPLSPGTKYHRGWKWSPFTDFFPKAWKLITQLQYIIFDFYSKSYILRTWRF